jgi:hypothetical protein
MSFAHEQIPNAAEGVPIDFDGNEITLIGFSAEGLRSARERLDRAESEFSDKSGETVIDLVRPDQPKESDIFPSAA